MNPRLILPATAVVLAATLSGCGGQDAASTGATATPPTTAATSAPMTASVSDTTPATPSDSPTAMTTTPEPATTVLTNSAAPTPSSTSSPTAPAAKAGGTVKEKSIEDYGDAAIAAWARGDRATLAKYVSSNARAKATSAPSGELLRTACDGDMCSYSTEGGERVTLTFDRDIVKAGRTGGIVGVKVD